MTAAEAREEADIAPLPGTTFGSMAWHEARTGARTYSASIEPLRLLAGGIVLGDALAVILPSLAAHMLRYLTSILTLYPGDVISSGTPDGVGAGRKPPEFLKPGDVVTIEIDGIGTLRTPMRGVTP